MKIKDMSLLLNAKEINISDIYIYIEMEVWKNT